MKKKLKEDAILSNTDWYLPELYSFLEKLGITVIVNNVSRYVIDPNRDIKCTTFDNYNKSLIYIKNSFNNEIYNELPSKNEITSRTEMFYNEYHNTLKK